MNAVFLLVTLDLDLEAKGAGSLEHTRQRTAHRQTRANRHGWVDRRAQVVEHLSSRPRCCAPVNNTVVRSLTHVIPSSMVVQVWRPWSREIWLKKNWKVSWYFFVSSQEPFVQIQSLVATFFENCRGIEDNCQNIVNSKSLWLDFRMISGLNDRIKSFIRLLSAMSVLSEDPENRNNSDPRNRQKGGMWLKTQ